MPAQKHLRYAKISLKRRMRLVSFVEGGMTIVRAASKLGIKSSTAKLIVKRFRTVGTYYESKASKMERDYEEKEPQQSQNVQINLQTNVREIQVPIELNVPQMIYQPLPVECYYQISPFSCPYYFYQLGALGWGFPRTNNGNC